MPRLRVDYRGERDDVCIDIVRFHERRFHCAYVPEDESVCVCGEGKCLDYFEGIITVKLGIEKDGNRFLSFVRSIRGKKSQED